MKTYFRHNSLGLAVLVTSGLAVAGCTDDQAGDDETSTLSDDTTGEGDGDGDGDGDGNGDGDGDGDGSCTIVGCDCGTCDAGLECTEGVCTPPGMAWIPSGAFIRACGTTDTSECDPDEAPKHEVTLTKGFAIDLFEVTRAEYEVCRATGDCPEPLLVAPLCDSFVFDPVADADLPMVCVSWDAAKAFCASRGGLLPTEAQWERAARGTEGAENPWGPSPDPSCSHVVMEDSSMGPGCGEFDVVAVGSRPMGVSVEGVHDLLGNASELTRDWFGPIDATMDTDPIGPASGDRGVKKGGSYNSSYDNGKLRASNRTEFLPDVPSDATGFRCVVEPQ